jgi:hypothetical protein
MLSKFNKNVVFIKDTVEVFINYGYKLQKDDMINLIKNDIFIDKKYIEDEIINDPEINNLCQEKNLLEYGIKPNILCLYGAINKKYKLPQIKKMINTYKLVPNMECLQIACSKKDNIAIVRYLIQQYKLKPDLVCLKNHINSFNRLGITTQYILDNI